MSCPRPLLTERLVLLPATPALVRADLAGAPAFAAALGFGVPTEWPPAHHDEAALRWTLDALEQEGAPLGWHLHYVAALGAGGRPTSLVGAGGFKGPPDERGTVEIGYSVLPSMRRRGFATEAACALVRRAFETPAVTRVVAETLPELEASIGVLRKCGFQIAEDPSERTVVRYEIRRRVPRRVST